MIGKICTHKLLVSHAPQIPLGKSRPTPWQSATIPVFSAKGIKTGWQTITQTAIHPASVSIASYSNITFTPLAA